MTFYSHPHLILLISVLGQCINMEKEETMQNLFRPYFLYLVQYFVFLPFPDMLDKIVIDSSHQLDYEQEHCNVYSGAFSLHVSVPRFF